MKYHTKKKERMQSKGIWLLALGVLLAGIVCLANLQAYAVSDGEQTIHVYLLSENTEQALEAAGFPPEDYAVVSESDSDWMRNVTLQKKFEVVISADGTMQTIKTIGAPVSQLLAEAGVDLGAYDIVTPSLDTRIKGPGRIAVDRVTVETETVSTVLPYETLKRTTSDLAVGEVRVAQEGIAGEGREVYKITKVNGEETERELLSQDILVEPQTLILENGTSGKLESRGEVIRYKKVLDVKATAYTSSSGAYTASGTVARVGAIAVDPKVIPLGSRVYITSDDGTSWIYGYAVCEDTGGKIKGNRIDLFFNTESECINFGVKQAKVYIL